MILKSFERIHNFLGKSKVEKLTKCRFEGRTYFEGEIMRSKIFCYSCLCTKNFRDLPVTFNPNCKKIDCGISLKYMKEVREGCIPIYYNSDSCCPIEWRCPSQNDRIKAKIRFSSFEKCSFGKLTLNVGDILDSGNKCDTCRCTYPPMLHCIRNPHC